MINCKIYKILALITLLFTISFKAHSVPIFVTDYTNTLSYTTKREITSSLLAFQNDYRLHMGIVVFANFEDKNPDGLMKYYYTQLNTQNPGIPGKAILLISLDDAYVNLQLSQNVEPIITDAVREKIIGTASQLLRQEQYTAMVKEPIRIINETFNPAATAQPQPTPAAANGSSFIRTLMMLILAGLCIAGGYFGWNWYKKK